MTVRKQKLLTIIFAIVITSLLAVILIGSKAQRLSTEKTGTPQTPTPLSEIESTSSAILFYSDNCPHCRDVDNWIAKNQLEQELKIIRKEISRQPTNIQEMRLIAQECSLNRDSLGVPFLFAQGNCYLGTAEIISYLSKITKP